MPTAWKKGVVRLIPKDSAAENPANPGDFTPIALTSCVGKVYTTVLMQQMALYALKWLYGQEHPNSLHQ